MGEVCGAMRDVFGEYRPTFCRRPAPRPSGGSRVLVPAVQFSDFILAIHILAVVIGFGVDIRLSAVLRRRPPGRPEVMPWLWSVLLRIDRYLVNPGLLVVVLAGVYLASVGHNWSAFFVQWGIGAAIVIGALVGSYMIPREKKLTEIAARDVAAAGCGAAAGRRCRRRGGHCGGARGARDRRERDLEPGVQRADQAGATMGALLDLIVIVTVFVMATHAGA